MKLRHVLLGMALLATLVAVFWTSPREPVDSVVEPVKRKHDQRTAKTGNYPPVEEKPELAVDGNRMSSTRINLFPKQTWVPPPPPPKPVVPPPPPPPTPPALPFKYLGRWVDDGQETIFLALGDRPEPIRLGQVLPGSWRVDEITRLRVVFTYLPLNMQTTLGITP